MSPLSPRTIDDLLNDPLIRKVMRADRVDAASLKTTLAGVAEKVVAGRRARGLTFDFSRFRRAAQPQETYLLPPAVYSGCESGLCC